VRLQLRNYIVNVGLAGPIKVFAPLEEDPADGSEEALAEQAE